MKSTAKDAESLLIEEDGSHPEKHKESKKTEMDAMIKVLRKDREVGKNEIFRDFAVPIALYVVCNLFVDSLLMFYLLLALMTWTMKSAGVCSNSWTF